MRFKTKTLAVMLAVLVMLSVFPVVAGAATPSTQNMKSYSTTYYVVKNYSSSYCYNQYNYKARFGNTGCTAVSEAMALSMTAGKAISPNDTSFIGWIPKVGCSWKSSARQSHSSRADQMRKLGSLLQEGKAVVVRANSRHSVCAIGIRKNANVSSLQPSDILAVDPANARVMTLNNVTHGYTYQSTALFYPSDAALKRIKPDTSAVSPSTSEGYTATVTANTGLKLRTGPGTGYSTYTSVPKGTKLQVLGVSSGWATVSYGGRTLYASNQYLSPQSKPGTSTNTATPSGSTYTATVTANTGLKLRTGPGTNYSTYTAVPKGTKLEVQSVSNGWATVIYRGRTLYASNSYLSPQSKPGTSTTVTVPTQQPAQNSSTYTATVTANTGLKLRTGPGTNYGTYTAVPKGTRLEVVSVSNGWAKINYQGRTLYASNQYLSPQSAGGSSAPASTSYTAVVTANTGLKLRTGPGTNYGTYTAVPKGTRLEVLSVSNGWATVSYGGRTLYASNQYLQRV